VFLIDGLRNGVSSNGGPTGVNEVKLRNGAHRARRAQGSFQPAVSSKAFTSDSNIPWQYRSAPR